jgi:hypothetical protein
MSAKNGDKARHHKLRKRRILYRQRAKLLKTSGAETPKSADQNAG